MISASTTTAAGLAFITLGCAQASDSSLTQLTHLTGNEDAPVFSPDGQRVAFTSDGQGTADVMVYDLVSKTITSIAATDADEATPQWSRDGDRIVYTSDTEGYPALFVFSIDRGVAQRITDREDAASRPFWSPTHDRIAFRGMRTGASQVWVVDSDGSGMHRVSNAQDDHVPYDWSPDGSYVLTVRYGAKQNLWAYPVDGGEPMQLTTHDGEEWRPMWSPQGDRVVFYTTWDDAMTEVYTADVTTGELTRITDLPVEDFHPAWSPDGQWIAFNSDRVNKSGLWLASKDGSVKRPIATKGRVGSLPAWSPDGRTVAFSYLISKPKLFSVPADGGEPLALTDGTRSIVEPIISSDGRFVAFESEDVGSEADLFMLDMATLDITRLTQQTTYFARPSWSPDGTALAFERSLGGGPRTNQVGIRILGDTAITLLTSSGYVRYPVWCGSTVIYELSMSDVGQGPDQLWQVPALGGDARQLTDGNGDKVPTDCSDDGTRLLFMKTENGTTTVWAADVTPNGALRNAVSLGSGEGARWGPNQTHAVMLSIRDGMPDLYVVSSDGQTTRRLTQSPLAESWPDWAGDRIIFSANPEGRDIWLAEVGVSGLDDPSSRSSLILFGALFVLVWALKSEPPATSS